MIEKFFRKLIESLNAKKKNKKFNYRRAQMTQMNLFMTKVQRHTHTKKRAIIKKKKKKKQILF